MPFVDAAPIEGIAVYELSRPVGAPALAAPAGLDTCVATLEVQHDGFGAPKFAPCPLLRHSVPGRGGSPD
jgi:3-hydroxybutyryl-CoA dehydrogenase